jgi:hypothetical protein
MTLTTGTPSTIHNQLGGVRGLLASALGHSHDPGDSIDHALTADAILAAGKSIVRDNADRLTSCLVLGTEERP